MSGEGSAEHGTRSGIFAASGYALLFGSVVALVSLLHDADRQQDRQGGRHGSAMIAVAPVHAAAE